MFYKLTSSYFYGLLIILNETLNVFSSLCLKDLLCSISLVCTVTFEFFGLCSILAFLQIFFLLFYLFNQPHMEDIAKAVEDLGVL